MIGTSTTACPTAPGSSRASRRQPAAWAAADRAAPGAPAPGGCTRRTSYLLAGNPRRSGRWPASRAGSMAPGEPLTKSVHQLGPRQRDAAGAPSRRPAPRRGCGRTTPPPAAVGQVQRRGHQAIDRRDHVGVRRLAEPLLTTGQLHRRDAHGVARYSWQRRNAEAPAPANGRHRTGISSQALQLATRHFHAVSIRSPVPAGLVRTK